MSNIIIPIDFSESTSVLLDKSIKFAKQIGGKIYLIHVAPADIGFAIGDLGFQYLPEVEKDEIKEELYQLNEFQKQAEAAGVDCEHILKQGVAADVILNYCDEKNADYIVVGSYGRSGMYDVLIGSLTKELTKLSNVPVLVIPIHKKKN